MTRLRQTGALHGLREGDRVYQRYSPQHVGTVTAWDRQAGFSVTYDGHGRKRGTPRERYSYRPYQAEAFLIGEPDPELFAVVIRDDDDA